MLKTSLSCLMLALALSGCKPAPQQASHDSAVPAATTLSPATADAPWWQDAVFYQIWPRSFYDTNGDGHGDFNGMTAKLPYLQDLGVDAIWLTPMFEAPSYHGYDFTEFYQVESDYGSMAEFEAFIQAADDKGMKVILDLVINHISREHEWFRLSAEGVAPYRDYFVWRKDLPAKGEGWGYAWDQSDKPEAVWHFDARRGEYYYAAFGATQPDLNLQHPDVVAEMKKMAKFWLDKGVAGFRLDAVRFVMETGPEGQADLPETIDYWRDFNAYVKSVNPEAYLVGEAWVDIPVAAEYWGNGEGLDQGFDFEVGYKILGQLLPTTGNEAQFGTISGTQSGELHPLQENLQRRQQSAAPLAFFSPFLTNHDQERVAYQLAAEPKITQQKAKLAAAMLFSSPGTKYIYYGEEIGLTQADTGHDVYKRAPMLWSTQTQGGFTPATLSWVEQAELFTQQFENWWPAFLQQQLAQGGSTVAEQQAQPDSVWRLYQWLIAQKKQRPELKLAGSYQVTELANGILHIERELNGSKTRFVLNLSDSAQDISSLLNTEQTANWAFDLQSNMLAAYGLLILQTP
ncbi:alpha-amylase family glycosyl hydrolase [Alishewanella sp. HL-SH05]|uniref:alpha-amylase family glycosyl hydrolase n=1 Tax=Alishewanella sp. HL-SH05 TaxID=3461145 RepID=UPI00404119F8